MLVFIIPLQSPEASKDWQQVSKITCKTIRSVLAQESKNFHSILVCNRRPDGLVPNKKLTIIEEAFGIPRKSEERMQDKWSKVRRGMITARDFSVTHLMVVDADDLVSNRLAGWVASYPSSSPGWIIRDGYVQEEGSRFLMRNRALNTICGTTSIIAVDRNELPVAMDSGMSHVMLEHGHSVIAGYFERLGSPLKKLPFPAAIYVTGTGENDSGASFSFAALYHYSRKLLIEKFLNMRYATGSLRREFGIE